MAEKIKITRKNWPDIKKRYNVGHHDLVHRSSNCVILSENPIFITRNVRVGDTLVVQDGKVVDVIWKGGMQ